MKLDFSDQVIAITGAGCGLGAAAAKAFRDAGGKVVEMDIDPKAPIHEKLDDGIADRSQEVIER